MGETDVCFETLQRVFSALYEADEGTETPCEFIHGRVVLRRLEISSPWQGVSDSDLKRATDDHGLTG